MFVASLAKGSSVNWVEWKPILVTGGGLKALSRRHTTGLTTVSVLIFIPLAIIGIFSNHWPIYLQLIPLFISLFLFGMPHGGADHLLLWGMLHEDTWSRRIFAVSLYILVTFIYLVFWKVQPLEAAIFFLCLTIFHWGQGDRFITAQLHGARYLVRSKVLSILHILLRGSIPVLLPGFLSHKTYRDVIEALVCSGGKISYQAQWITDHSFYFLLVPLILFSAYTLSSLFRVDKKELGAFRVDLLEGIILFIWFLIIPPLWAIGCYFTLWHSLRHTLRILWTDCEGSQLLESIKFIKLKLRWLQLTSFMTIIALIGMWLILNVSFSLKGIEINWLAKALIGISVLTLPHTIVVSYMDRKQLVETD